MTAEEKKAESIGEHFRKTRLKRKITMDQAYKDTKIHPNILTALEEDRYEEFLSPTYIKAFIKSYCRYLELDANTILEEYNRILKEQPEPTLVVKAQKRKGVLLEIDWKGYLRKVQEWFLPIGGIVLAVILVVLLFRGTSAMITRIRTDRTAVAERKTESRKPDQAIIKPLSIPRNKPLHLIIKTKGDAWLKVMADDETIFESILKKGSVESYNAQKQFRLHTGKGEYVELILNGNPLGSPGGGVIKNIMLTHKGLRIEKKKR